MMFKNTIALGALLLFGLASLNAQTNNGLIPRQVLFDTRAKNDFQFNTDGSFFLYSKQEIDEERFVFITPVDAPDKPQRIAFDGPIQQFKFIDANGVLAIVKSGNELKLQYASLPSGTLRDVTPFPFEAAQIVATSPRFDEKAVVHFKGIDNTKSGYYIIDSRRNRPKRIFALGGVEKAVFDQNFNAIAAERSEWGFTKIQRRAGGFWETIATDTVPSTAFAQPRTTIVGSSVDGNTFHFTAPHQDLVKLYFAESDSAGVVELKTKEETYIADWNAQTASLGRYGDLIALQNNEDHKIYHVVNEGDQTDFEFLKSKLNGNLQVVDTDSKQTRWLVKSSGSMPAEYYAFLREPQQLIPLGFKYLGIDTFALASAKKLYVPSKDKRTNIPIQLFSPAGADRDNDGIPDRAYPTVMIVPDGSRAINDPFMDWETQRLAQLFANRRYTVIVCGYRGLKGYGNDFLEDANKAWGTVAVEDLMSIAYWARDNKIFRGSLVGLIGEGYGGSVVLKTLQRRDFQFGCAAVVNPIVDFEELAHLPENSDYWTKKHLGDFTKEADSLNLIALSPNSDLKKIGTPLVFAYGEAQETNLVDAMAAFAANQAEQGNTMLTISYPDDGKKWTDVGTWSSFWAYAERFFTEYLRGKYEPGAVDASLGNLDLLEGSDWTERLD